MWVAASHVPQRDKTFVGYLTRKSSVDTDKAVLNERANLKKSGLHLQ
jgi:hypothetical protein